jgi:membrane-associated protein
MEQVIDFILHLDKHVKNLADAYGPWAYAILFAVIFAETGLIVVPFLPGDSLLFVLGIFSVPPQNSFNVLAIFGLLTLAAGLGDQVNYRIGKTFGVKLFSNPNSKLFKPSHLEITQAFYRQHGAKTVLLARFVPIVRALAPFVAGMSEMEYGSFCAWSVSGAVLWVSVCVFGGFLFGNIPIVKEHFEIGLLVIVIFSILPAIVEVVRHKTKKKSE